MYFSKLREAFKIIEMEISPEEVGRDKEILGIIKSEGRGRNEGVSGDSRENPREALELMKRVDQL